MKCLTLVALTSILAGCGGKDAPPSTLPTGQWAFRTLPSQSDPDHSKIQAEGRICEVSPRACEWTKSPSRVTLDTIEHGTLSGDWFGEPMTTSPQGTNCKNSDVVIKDGKMSGVRSCYMGSPEYGADTVKMTGTYTKDGFEARLVHHRQDINADNIWYVEGKPIDPS